MSCNPEMLKTVPLFALLDDDETAVLASQVDVRNFAARERIYKIGDIGRHGIRHDFRKGACHNG